MSLPVATVMIQNLQKYFGKMCLKNGKNNEPQIVASVKNNVMLDPQIPTKQEKEKVMLTKELIKLHLRMAKNGSQLSDLRNLLKHIKTK